MYTGQLKFLATMHRTKNDYNLLLSVTKSCLAPCDPMDCSTPGFPILHYLLGFAQNYVHWISDAIQQFYHLSPPSPPAHNLSDGKTVGRTQNAVSVIIKLKDPHLFPHQKQYSLKLKVKEGLKLIIENLKEQGPLIIYNNPIESMNTPILGVKKVKR